MAAGGVAAAMNAINVKIHLNLLLQFTLLITIFLKIIKT